MNECGEQLSKVPSCEIYTLAGHNPLSTQSRTDVHVGRVEFLFCGVFFIINALQLFLFKPEVFLVFSRESVKCVPRRRI